MTGYWTINQGVNARRKLLCPTETHTIDIKVKHEENTLRGMKSQRTRTHRHPDSTG